MPVEDDMSVSVPVLVHVHGLHVVVEDLLVHVGSSTCSFDSGVMIMTVELCLLNDGNHVLIYGPCRSDDRCLKILDTRIQREKFQAETVSNPRRKI